MKFFTLLFVLSALPSCVFSQASPVLKHQRLDFMQFEHAFQQVEAKPNLHITENELKENLAKLKEELRTPHSPLEQFKLYSEFLAQIQCGHTSVAPSKAVIREWGKQRQCLPFDVVMVNKKLFISPIHPDDVVKPKKGEVAVKEKSKKAKEILHGGTEIYAIDQKNISEWMTAISPYISSDEDGMDFKYYVAGQLFDFYRYLAVPTHKDSVRIDYIYKRDTLHQFVKLGYPLVHTLNDRLNEEKENKKEKEKNFGTFGIEKNKYGYFRFESFKNSKGKKYDEFLKTSFETMKKKKIDKLIIDLRGNTGGIMQIELLRYLLPADTQVGQYIFEKKFKRKQLRKMGIKMGHEATRTYLKNMKTTKKMLLKFPGYHGEMTVPSNTSGVFKGDIVVITDEATFSAASALASHLKTLCDAKVVGQTAGGTFYAGNAGTLQLELKKCNLTVQLNPNFFSTQLYPGEIDSHIKTPDVVTFSEIFIPDDKFVKKKDKKEGKTADDDVIKVAEKLIK